MSESAALAPLFIRMHEADNVAIVVNDGGLPVGAGFASGLTLRESVPQGHKVSLVDLAAGAPVLRYNVVIGEALRDIAAATLQNIADFEAGRTDTPNRIKVTTHIKGK